MESHPYLLHRQCRLIAATLFQLFGRLHIKTVLSIGDLSLEPSSEQLFRTILPAEDNCSTDSFSAPSGFFASASTILISTTQSSGFLSQESPVTDMLTQFASLRNSLVLVDYLWVSWRSMSCFASLHDRIRAGRTERLSFQSRSHVHLPSILWIHVVCSDCAALLHTAQIPAETVVA